MVTLNALAVVIALSGAGETVLLDFTSPTCGPCLTMEPTIGRLTRDGYPVKKIDVTRHPELAARFQVTGVPCFVMLAGGQEVDRVIGACSHARLVQMFGKARPPETTRIAAQQRPRSNSETVRAQSPETQSPETQSPETQSPETQSPETQSPETQSPESKSMAVASAVASGSDPRRNAFEATVRLRIEDPNGHSIGTGTVVDGHGKEVLAVTCGHIFRDSAGQGKVLVDLFPNGQKHTVEGTLISYDLTRDIGLVSFVPGFAVSPVRIAPAGHRFAQGDTVFSVGCDNGSDPSIRDSRITSIDRYLGPPNIETTGEPAPGRSGGGLFSMDGYLIGICNHGDPRDDEGIYASLPTIHWELDRVGQRRIYEPRADALAAQGLSPSRVASDQSQPRRLSATAESSPRTVSPVAQASFEQAATSFSKHSPTDTEVVCIIRSRGNPQAEEQVYVLEQPSADLLNRLANESRKGSPGNQLATRHIPVPRQNNNPVRVGASGDPVVRAQSSDRRY